VGRHTPRRSRALTRLRWGLAAVTVSAGALALVAPPGDPGTPGAAGTRGAPPAPVLVRGPAAAADATPVQVSIPAIDVQSSLADLGVDDEGALVPPSDFAQAGWFAAGPVPGDVGPAVIAGHVDSRTGPAVFFRLEELAVGDIVQVTRTDDRDVGFRVTRVAQYPKDDFATEEVYGPTTGAELRLITCGGTFDPSRRSYRDNVVVYAVAVG
jgi:LPXTG-site transpeptidase (sortase) family protein